MITQDFANITQLLSLVWFTLSYTWHFQGNRFYLQKRNPPPPHNAYETVEGNRKGQTGYVMDKYRVPMKKKRIDTDETVLITNRERIQRRFTEHRLEKMPMKRTTNGYKRRPTVQYESHLSCRNSQLKILYLKKQFQYFL